MTSDLENAAGSVIELTNTLGATAASVQNTTHFARTVRSLAAGAARHPERLAGAGAAMIAAAGVLALSQPDHSPRAAG